MNDFDKVESLKRNLIDNDHSGNDVLSRKMRELRCLSSFGTYEPHWIFSNCCHAPIYKDTDICSNEDCGEHCKVMRECPECEGDGSKDNKHALDPNKQDCVNCKGSGEVEL